MSYSFWTYTKSSKQLSSTMVKSTSWWASTHHVKTSTYILMKYKRNYRCVNKLCKDLMPNSKLVLSITIINTNQTSNHQMTIKCSISLQADQLTSQLTVHSRILWRKVPLRCTSTYHNILQLTNIHSKLKSHYCSHRYKWIKCKYCSRKSKTKQKNWKNLNNRFNNTGSRSANKGGKLKDFK